QRGVAAALEAVSARSPIPVRIVAERLARHSEALEAAVYFCCLECLQNATKHARPRATLTVLLGETNRDLTFTLRDDGAGFDPGAAKRGAGLTNLAERIEALGGTLEVDTGTGRGTRVTGRLPAS